MINNYLKSAFRNLWKTKFYSGMNIFGLSIGITAVVLILVYLQHEWSYDRFHKNGDSLYRISVLWNWEGRQFETPRFLAPVGPALKADYPQVKQFLRLRGPFSDYFYHRDEPVRLEKIYHADSSFFDLLSFSLLTGDPKLALTAPYSMVMTRSYAKRIFGGENAVGKTLESGAGDLYTVTAIAENPPPNSSIDFNALISFCTLYKDPKMYMGWYGGNQYVTYIQLHENADPIQLEKRLPDLVKKNLSEQASIKYTLFLQPFKKIHLFHDSGNVYLKFLLFGSIALLILIVASINFINLSLAQSAKRAKEIGVRKVLGADRKNLVFQFLTESILSTILATVFAVCIVEIIFPAFTRIIGREMPRLSLFNGSHVVGLLFIAVVVGLAAGSLPAFHLASLLPVKILKNSTLSGHKRRRFRDILLIFQFSVSILLISGTMIIYKQHSFMRNKVLGFNKENILVVNLPTTDLKAKNRLLKNSIEGIPTVTQASLCSAVPHRGFESNGYLPEGFNTSKLMNVVFTDEDFLNTFGIKLLKGRNFDPEMATDKDAYLINEALMRTLDWNEPIGKTIQRVGAHTVIGVVQDFHFATMVYKIEPLIISIRPEYGDYNHLALRISSNDISSTIQQIRQKVAEVVPSAPFEYWFLDDAFNALYRDVEQVNKMVFSFSVLAIFIAILGLYSLVAIATEYKTKEIGIRKVLGSSVNGITQVILKEFLSPVLISNLIAWPIAWYAMNRLLQKFAYRIDLTIWPFLLSGLFTLLIALLTVSWQAIRAATSNPVEALRYE